MKKTGKILLGVLSVGALVGTGYATWHINGGFVGETNVEVAPEIEVEVFRPFASIIVAQKDDRENIKFDGKAGEHLTKTYNIKANKGTGEFDKDPYDLDTYKTLADEYKPNLHVHTYVYKAGQLLDEKDPFFKYVVIPQTIDVSYETWLASTLKDSGYDHTVEFSRSEETLEGKNPEDAWANLSADQQAANYKELISALDGVTFKLDFVVGQKDYIAPTAPVTGDVTIPTVQGSELRIAGIKDGKLDAGTHDIEIDLIGENTVIKNDTLTITETLDGKATPHEVNLTEKGTRAVARTYTTSFTFKEKASYTFAYEVVKVGTVGVTPNENVDVTVKVGQEEYKNTELVENTTVTVKATAKEGYKLGEVKVNDRTLTGKDGTYTFNVVAGMNTITTTATQITGKITTEIDENTTVKFIANGKEVNTTDDLALGTEVTVEATAKEGYELKTLTYNGTSILETKKFTIVEGENKVVATSTEKIIEPVIKYGQITFTEVEGLTVEFVDAEGTTVQLNKDVKEGTVITVKVTPVENYELATLTHNGTDISKTLEFSVAEGANDIVATAKFNEPTAKFMTIAEAVKAEIKTPINVKGKLIVCNKKNNLIYDGTDYIEIYGTLTGVTEGDVVEAKGIRAEYNGSAQIGDFEVKKIEESLEVELPQTAATLTAEFLESKTIDEFQLYREFIEVTGKYTASGSFQNLEINGTEKVISIKPSAALNFEHGKYYTIKGFVSGTSGGKFINTYVVENAIKTFNVESVKIDNGDTAELPVDSTLKLNTSVLPAEADQSVKYEINSGKEFATISEDGIITGVAEGVAIVKVSSLQNPEKFAQITVTITKKPELSGEVVNKTYSYKFVSGDLNIAGGTTKQLNGLVWEYSKSNYISIDGSASGDFAWRKGMVQIGTKNNPQKTPWILKTSLPSEVTIASYSVSVASGDKATSKISYGSLIDSADFTSADNKKILSKEGLNEKTNTFGIELAAILKAMYISEISFTFDIPAEYADLFANIK